MYKEAVRIGVLGAVRAEVGGSPVQLGGPRQRLVLAHLVLRANEVVPTDRLVDAVWDGQRGSRSSLHTYISHLRKAIGADRIERHASGHAYRLRLASEEVDALQFEQLAVRGRELAETAPAQAVAVFDEALALWQGPPFADLGGEASLRTAIDRLEELRLVVLEDRIAARLAHGDGAALAAELDALTAEHPLRERFWGLRMVALYRGGRQAEALAVYTRARDLLADELGIDPSPELQLVHAQILRQDPALRPAVVTAGHTPPVRDLPPPPNPYKGLRPFTEADADAFFGRKGLTARLVRRLAEGTPLLCVVGPSGSGKSSLVHAGLVPAVRAGALPGSQDWHVTTFTPGTAPLAALRGALESLIADRGALLVVDQLEEAWTQCGDEAEREAFLDLLAATVTERGHDVRVAVTLRADFYDRPLAHPGVAEVIRDGTEAVVPLSAGELQQAITAPAERVGVRVQPELVAHVVGDVTAQPGALPLLQYALTEVFDRRSDGVLDVATYRSVGGVSGALARRAEDLHRSLSDTGRDTTRQLLLRLVTPGEGVGDTRRRVLRGALTAGLAGADDLVEVFGAARLLSFDQEPRAGAATVEIAHEALLGEWRRLRDWVDAARDDLRVQRRLAEAAAQWVASDRDASYLASGSRLAELEAWREGTALALTDDEDSFLHASVRARDEQQAAELARDERERALEQRSYRRLRALVAVLAGAALVAAGLTVYAVRQGQRAAGEALVARARELAAAADANVTRDPERSILLALEAVAATRHVDGRVLPEAESALHRATGASRARLSVPGVGGAAAWSPTGDVFVTEGPDDTGIVDLRDARTGASVRAWRGHDVDVNDVTFSPDGRLLATTGDDGDLRVWDRGTGEEVLAQEARDQEVWGPSFSPDGALVAAWWKDEWEVRIIDVGSGDVTATFPSQSKRTAFSPDGARFAHATADAVVVVDLADGSTVLELPHAWVQRMAWSPDGRWIATCGDGWGSTVRIWDAATGQLWDTAHGHRGDVFDLAWSPDSRRLATAGHDRTTRIWDLTEDGAVEALRLSSEQVGAVYGVAFSPDGTRVLASDFEISGVTIFDVSPAGDAEWSLLPARNESVTPIAFSDDGTLVAASRPGEVVGWDPVTGEERWSLLHGLGDIRALDVNTSAGVGAVADDVAVARWDLTTRRPRRTALRVPGTLELTVGVQGEVVLSTMNSEAALRYDADGSTRPIFPPALGWTYWHVAFDGTGRRFAATQWDTASGAEKGRVRVWNLEEREVVVDVPGLAYGLAVDDTGQRLAMGTRSGAKVVDVSSGQLLVDLPDHSGRIVALSGDGRLVASGDVDGTVRVFDVATGAERLSVARHTSPVGDLAFNPDGTKLASSGYDGTIRVWAIDLDDLITLARSRVTRTLSDDECRRFLHLPSCS
jgi:WD40 repeat protein/DNA-binding SARP family transcriptional activator